MTLIPPLGTDVSRKAKRMPAGSILSEASGQSRNTRCNVCCLRASMSPRARRIMCVGSLVDRRLLNPDCAVANLGSTTANSLPARVAAKTLEDIFRGEVGR
eukprot:15465107-Alexandrium_andersonii.AAC.1